MSTRDTVLRVANELGASRAEQTLFLHIMRAESGGQANARNSRSSATGIFQFLNQTWLAEMKAHGAEHGYGHLAAQITRGSDGRWHAPQHVLDLRNDPEASARMMYEFTESNRAGLHRVLGREPNAGELYLAHFAGLGGAKEVLEANPSARLRDLPIMSRALSANPTIAHFTAGQLHAWAIAKMDGDVDAVRQYDAAASHTRDEEDEERRRRRRTLQGFGLSDEQIDAVDAEGNLMGTGFLLLLSVIISGIANISAEETRATFDVPLPESPQGERVCTSRRAAPPETDTGLAAAIAAVPVPQSLRGQQPVPADQNSPTVPTGGTARAGVSAPALPF